MWAAYGELKKCLAKADATVLPFPARPKAMAAAERRRRGGIGSRGGHVLGYTKSNKPIYSHDHEAHDKVFKIGSHDHVRGGITLPAGQAAAATMKAHKGWSATDHVEASDAHLAASKAHADPEVAGHAVRVAQAHLHAATRINGRKRSG